MVVAFGVSVKGRRRMVALSCSEDGITLFGEDWLVIFLPKEPEFISKIGRGAVLLWKVRGGRCAQGQRKATAKIVDARRKEQNPTLDQVAILNFLATRLMQVIPPLELLQNRPELACLRRSC